MNTTNPSFLATLSRKVEFFGRVDYAYLCYDGLGYGFIMKENEREVGYMRTHLEGSAIVRELIESRREDIEKKNLVKKVYLNSKNSKAFYNLMMAAEEILPDFCQGHSINLGNRIREEIKKITGEN